MFHAILAHLSYVVEQYEVTLETILATLVLLDYPDTGETSIYALCVV